MSQPGKGPIMGEGRIHVEVDRGVIDSAMKMLSDLPDRAKTNFMRTVVEAVYGYQQTGNAGVLTQLADDVAMSVRVHSDPALSESVLTAPTHPVGSVRPVAEVFASLRR